MKKQRIYIDTSVIGGCFDDEFRIYSVKLFNRINLGLIEAVISEVTLKELENAPKSVQQIITDIDEDNITILQSSEEINDLAFEYISNKIVTNKYFEDALHIAYATYFDVDVLVSWNFKHIVNFNKIKLFNSVNLKEGYKALEIRSPKELFYE